MASEIFKFESVDDEDDDGWRRTDDGPLVYYKLTLWAFGSGELKRWKYQAPFLVFQNTETMDYIGKLLKRTETRKKLTWVQTFQLFRNV